MVLFDDISNKLRFLLNSSEEVLLMFRIMFNLKEILFQMCLFKKGKRFKLISRSNLKY